MRCEKIRAIREIRVQILILFINKENDKMSTIQIKRLGLEEWELAGQLFRLMAEVFEEERAPLSAEYLGRLLCLDWFWVLAAFRGDELVGGLTAYVLPLTRVEASEVFIYDLAVREEYQRQGIGRLLMAAVQEQARAQGIPDLFVPADNEDEHAIDFYHAIGWEASAVTFFTAGSG